MKEPAYGDNLHWRLSCQTRHPARRPNSCEDSVFGLGWRQCTSAGQGWPSVPVARDGEKGPCALPRIWGRSLERKFAFLLT
ncbi:hypothetical protein [Desulfosporosinus burensis]